MVPEVEARVDLQELQPPVRPALEVDLDHALQLQRQCDPPSELTHLAALSDRDGRAESVRTRIRAQLATGELSDDPSPLFDVGVIALDAILRSGHGLLDEEADVHARQPAAQARQLVAVADVRGLRRYHAAPAAGMPADGLDDERIAQPGIVAHRTARAPHRTRDREPEPLRQRLEAALVDEVLRPARLREPRSGSCMRAALDGGTRAADPSRCRSRGPAARAGGRLVREATGPSPRDRATARPDRRSRRPRGSSGPDLDGRRRPRSGWRPA